MKEQVTICTVAYTHESLLEINWEFVKRLNSHTAYTWIVVENSPADSPERLDLGDLRFKVLPGLEKKNQLFAACYHAAGAFMGALERVETRFILLLDPDFFVVKSNWINEMMMYMKKKNLAFFGAPIHPMLYHKWRYFPCTQLMMIDLEKTGRVLDLMPRYELKYDLTVPATPRATKISEKFTFAKLKEQARLMLKRGSIIDSSLDTAWQLYQEYKDRPELYECVQPVLKLSEQPLRPRWLNSRANRLLEKFLPDRWCYIPKQKNYFTEIGFKERGAFDAAGQGWDETIFEEKPFSFHLRGALSNGTIKDHSGEIPALRQALVSFP